MGSEAFCKVRFGEQESEGKALLETGEIVFRGRFRVKIPFSTVKSAKAVDGELCLQTAKGPATFQLGATAEKWLEKILHPKSRIEKLGVKSGAKKSFATERSLRPQTPLRRPRASRCPTCPAASSSSPPTQLLPLSDLWSLIAIWATIRR